MRIEIDNIREVKEVVISSDGSIPSNLPEYAGHVAKIVILDQKGKDIPQYDPTKILEKRVETHIDTYRIEGLKHQRGIKRSRQTAKEFARLISNSIETTFKSPSWITLKKGIQIKYSNSIIYEGDEGDFIWYSFSYKELVEHLNNGTVIIAFIIRKSQKMVYINAQDIIEDLKRASKLRDNDWLHIHLIFTNNIIKFHVKTVKNNHPIEKEIHYVSWDKFLTRIEEIK